MRDILQTLRILEKQGMAVYTLLHTLSQMTFSNLRKELLQKRRVLTVAQTVAISMAKFRNLPLNISQTIPRSLHDFSRHVIKRWQLGKHVAL